MILCEVRNAWRRWCRRPGYTALSIAVLGVGLGVVLFLFSLVNTLMPLWRALRVDPAIALRYE